MLEGQAKNTSAALE